MRVLLVTSEFHPRVGGIERYVDDLATALDRHAEILLITAEGQHLAENRRFSIISRLNLAYPGSPGEFLSIQRELVRIAISQRIDVVHLASAGLAVYAPPLSDVCPVFITIHCKDFTRPWQLVPGSEDVIAAIVSGLAQCKRIFCVSRYTAARVRHFVASTPIEILTPGLTPHILPSTMPLVAAPWKRRAEYVNIVTVGKMVRRKGHLELLGILERLSVPVNWTIIGDGPCASALRSSIAASPRRADVRMLGLLDDAAMWQEMAAADLFALTPLELRDKLGIDAEGFGLVYIEAAAMGVPCVGSVYGGCRDAIEPLHGLVVDPLKPDDAAAAISDFLDNETEDMALTRRRASAREFSWKNRIDALVGFYRSEL